MVLQQYKTNHENDRWYAMAYFGGKLQHLWASVKILAAI